MNPFLPIIPRRVVTGIHKGRSVIVEDALSSNVSELIPGLVISDIWATNTMPVDLNKEHLIENTLLPVTPRNGSYFRYVSIPPDKDIQAYIPGPLMHTTETLDYIIIISGEVYLVLDEEETLLKAGDIVIQRATHHAWSNRSDRPCIQLAILLDAKVG
jgi:quercetin dioxygenase-like cupin family protein